MVINNQKEALYNKAKDLIHHRKAVLFELSEVYCKLALERNRQASLLWPDIKIEDLVKK